LPEEWKGSIIVFTYRKGDTKDCNNYRCISLLPTTYRILCNILLSRLTPYAEERIGDHQGRFKRNRSTTDHIFCIHQILEKIYDYNEAVHQLFINVEIAYDSLRTEALCNNLIEFGILMKLVRLIKMCLNETYNRVWVGRHLFDIILIRNGLKQGDALLLLLFNFALDYTIKRVQVNLEGLKLNGTHQLLGYADDVNILGGSVHTTKENNRSLIVASKEDELDVNADNTKHMACLKIRMQLKSPSVKFDNSSLKGWKSSNILEKFSQIKIIFRKKL